MRARCSNPNRTKDFAGYGGRGITVCERWMTFENFLEDMGEPPPGMTLDREDNDKGYEKSNCRWATPSQQAFNRKRKRPVETGVPTGLNPLNEGTLKPTR
jgi:hypothetical protein